MKRSRSTVTIILATAVLLAAGLYWTRESPAPIQPAPQKLPEPPAAVEPSPAPAKTEPAASEPATNLEWKPAGVITVEGETISIAKRGNERMTRRKDGSPVEQYLEFNGVREGPSTGYFQNGVVYSTGEWRAGKQQGIWTYFDDEGRIAEQGGFADGARDGEWQGFYPDGDLRWRGTFAAGVQVGTWTFVHPTGEVDLARSGTYENGKKIGN